jgi:hypothetical protein
MALTYDSIATQTVGTAVATINFNSIPTTFSDLRLVLQGAAASSNNHFMRFNSNSASYHSYIMSTNGLNNQSFTLSNSTEFYLDFNGGGTTENSPFTIVDIFNYNSTTLNKSILVQSSQAQTSSGFVFFVNGQWQNTSAVTSINLFNYNAGNFPVGFVAALYGIKAA